VIILYNLCEYVSIYMTGISICMIVNLMASVLILYNLRASVSICMIGKLIYFILCNPSAYVLYSRRIYCIVGGSYAII
jgi:hypothetical protein